MAPSLLAGLRVDRVEVSVAAAEVHHATGDRGGARDADLIVDDRVVARLKLQISLPVAALIAYMLRSQLPMNTTPFETAGDA